MTMDDFAAFIAARYGEAEALAKAATPGPWIVGGSAMPWIAERITADGGRIRVIAGTRYEGESPAIEKVADAVYIADNDPAHRMADIKLKRAILARVVAIPHEYVEGDPWYSCRQAVRPSWDVDDSEPGEPDEPGSGCSRDDAGGPCDCGRDGLVGTILRQLGTEFSSHPAYPAKWAPE